MRNSYQQSERAALTRAVRGGESVAAAATRLGVGMSTAYRWVRTAPPTPTRPPRTTTTKSPTPTPTPAPPPPPLAPAPTFVELVRQPAPARPPSLRLRVGAVEIDVAAGFDPRLLRAVVDALGGDA